MFMEFLMQTLMQQVIVLEGIMKVLHICFIICAIFIIVIIYNFQVIDVMKTLFYIFL